MTHNDWVGVFGLLSVLSIGCIYFGVFAFFIRRRHFWNGLLETKHEFEEAYTKFCFHYKRLTTFHEDLSSLYNHCKTSFSEREKQRVIDMYRNEFILIHRPVMDRMFHNLHACYIQTTNYVVKYRCIWCIRKKEAKRAVLFPVIQFGHLAILMNKSDRLQRHCLSIFHQLFWLWSEDALYNEVQDLLMPRVEDRNQSSTTTSSSFLTHTSLPAAIEEEV